MGRRKYLVSIWVWTIETSCQQSTANMTWFSKKHFLLRHTSVSWTYPGEYLYFPESISIFVFPLWYISSAKKAVSIRIVATISIVFLKKYFFSFWKVLVLVFLFFPVLWYISSAKKVVAVRRGLVGLHQCYNLSRTIFYHCYDDYFHYHYCYTLLLLWWLLLLSFSFWWWWRSYRLHHCYNLSETNVCIIIIIK